MLISVEFGVFILMDVWLLDFVKCKLKFKLKLGIFLNLIIYNCKMFNIIIDDYCILNFLR